MAELTTCCYQCAADRGELIGAGPIGFLPQIMFLCADCGNKRCPRSTNHRNDCTGSNEPGQPGSRYGGQP